MFKNTKPIFYTVNEALQILKIGRTRFYELINAGEIKARKDGHRTLIPSSSIQDWFEKLPRIGERGQS